MMTLKILFCPIKYHLKNLLYDSFKICYFIKIKILLSVALIFVFVFNSFGSPTKFRFTKELTSGGEIAIFDATAFKHLRIGVMLVKANVTVTKTNITIEAVEGADSVTMQSFPLTQNARSNTVSFDAPPSRIRIRTDVSGVYKVFVWAD